MNKTILKAEIRELTGRKVKRLRTQGILPANISGKKVKSLGVQVNLKEFEAVYKDAGETGLVDLKVGSETRPVLIHNLQLNPKSDVPVHVDFLQVDLKEKVTAEVPVELIGESPVTKQGIGTVVQQINEIEVEALPADLPEKFEVNIEELIEVDQAIYVKDLKYDKAKVEIKDDLDAIVAKVEPPQKEEVVEVAPVVAEGEVPAEGVPAEGAPATAEAAAGKEAPKEEPAK
ncbi:MAG: 50S ribosomal protein L25 [bacterium]|nr:50S ribosomal protein L25 [bacterium]